MAARATSIAPVVHSGAGLAEESGSGGPSVYSVVGCGRSPLEWCSTARARIAPSSQPQYLAGLAKLRAYLQGALSGCGPGLVLLPCEIDELVGRYVDFVYACGTAEGLSLKARADHSFYGLLWAYPALKGHMFVSSAALRGFAKLRPSAERVPLPWGVLGVLAADEVRRAVALAGDKRGAEDFALETIVSADCFLRISEADGLLVRDVVSDGEGAVSLCLGVRKPTKTGRYEGVVVHDAFVAAAVLRACSGRPAGASLFGASREVFAGRLGAAASRWGLEGITPHILRHSGASHFGGVFGWGAADLLLRGRWKHLSSVARYVKPHVVVESWSGLPAELARLARAYERDPAACFARARAGLSLCA